jgi:hypothetical protein
MSEFTFATLLEISSDLCYSAYKVMMPAKPVSTLEWITGHLHFDLASINMRTIFPLVVAGLLLALCFLGVASVFLFTAKKLAMCLWKIVARLVRMFILEIWNFLINEFNHLTELVEELAELIGVVLVITVVSHLLFLFYLVHSFSLWNPERVVEIWLSFAFTYTSFISNVVTYFKSDQGMYVLTRVLNIVCPELLKSNVFKRQPLAQQPA